jgi:hypothetical protein
VVPEFIVQGGDPTNTGQGEHIIISALAMAKSKWFKLVDEIYRSA